MYDLGAYGAMIADTGRANVYARSLEARIRPDSILVDVGTGPGIMAVVACRAGARRVYAIEPDDVIQVAREAVAAHGFSDRVVFIQALSSEVRLPEPVDGIVSDLRGSLPLYGRNIAALIDARERWLKPGGWLIAESDSLWVSLVSSTALHDRYVANWNCPLGFDFTAAQERSANHFGRAELSADDIVAEGHQWAHLAYRELLSPNIGGEAEWTIGGPVTAHGLGVWFDTQVGPGQSFSNSPLSDKHVYRQCFFPWPRSLDLHAADQVRVRLRADLVDTDYVWSWSTDIRDGVTGTLRHTFRQSSFLGQLLPLAGLKKRQDGFVPELTVWGVVDRGILDLMVNGKSIAQIVDVVLTAHPDLFRTRKDALTRVGDLSARYSRDCTTL